MKSSIANMFDLNDLTRGNGLRETWDRVRSKAYAPAFMKQIQVGATPAETIFERGNLRLLRYASGATPAQTIPIVIIPSLINRHYILDLLPGRSLVEYLLGQGFEVFMIEWLAPKSEDRHLSLDRLSGQRIARALDRVARHSSVGKFHLIGHCLGGTLAILEAALRPERVKTLTLLTAPVDFSEAGKLGLWATESGLDVESMIDAYGNVPWPMMQAAFHLIKPTVGFGKWRRAIERSGDQDFLTSFLGLEIWANDNISLLGQVYRRVIRDLYQQNSLVKGEFEIDKRRIDLACVAMPVLDVIALDDHVVPPTMRWPSRSHPEMTTRLDLTGGHIGALLGRRAQKTFWPELSQWLQKSS